MHMLRPLFALFVLILPLSASAAEWQEMYTEEEVTVSMMELEGTKLFAFKGDTIMDAPASKVMYVLLDNDHRIDWVDRLYINEVLSTNGPHEYVLYQAFDLPALFASRDYVYRGVAVRESENVITLDLKSVEHADAPETVGIRADLVNTLYRLTILEDGRTRVEVEVQTDPKGWMPVWLVNLVQKTWPLETLNGLRGQLDKPFTGDYPLPGDDVAEEEATEEPASEEAVEEAPEEAAAEEAPAE
jgi:hypothetical protein